jgi:hypothetical protein
MESLARFLAKSRVRGRAEKKRGSCGARTRDEDTSPSQISTFASTATADGEDGDAQLSTRASAQVDRSGRGLAKGVVNGIAPSKTGASGLGPAEETIHTSSGEQNQAAETNEESRADPIPRADVHRVTAGPSQQDQKSIASPSFTHNTLWDEAYNNLKKKKKKAEFVEGYEKILFRVFLKDTASDTTSSSDQSGENTIARDPPLREEQMKQIVRKGLDKIEKAKDMTEGYGKFFDLVTPFEAVLDARLQHVPQAALPWAVVSACLDVSQLKTSCPPRAPVDIRRSLPSRRKQAMSFTRE